MSETMTLERSGALAGRWDGNWRSLLVRAGEAIQVLEERFAERLQVRYALAVSSGTAALEVALRASGVVPGDEVILSPYDWGAAAGATLRIGAIPVFGDIDAATYTLDPAMVEASLGPRTKAVVATHLFGHPADIDAIAETVRWRGIRIIEDAAQALGASLRGRPVGNLGDVACFSLGRGKVVTGGEGGMLVTNDRGIFESAVSWSQHPVRQMGILGRIGPLSDLGPNARIHPAAAAVAVMELNDLDARLASRRDNCARLGALLARIPHIRPAAVASGAEHAWHRYNATFMRDGATGLSREEFVDLLVSEGVPVTAGLIPRPLHLDPVFQRRGYGAPGWPWRCVRSARRYRPGSSPVAEERCASLDLVVGGDWAGATAGCLEAVNAAFQKVATLLGERCLADRSRLASVRVGSAPASMTGVRA